MVGDSSSLDECSKIQEPHTSVGDSKIEAGVLNGNQQSQTIIENMDKATGSGSILTAHNIGYSVLLSSGCGKRSIEVLKDINVVIKPGLTAIMGPTGSGKSTLLDVLAGRKDHHRKSGTLLMDGKPAADNFKCIIGYVVQDNILLDTLTVRDNINFSAALRLQKCISDDERRKRVEQIIIELGLQHCENTRIGNEFSRGISGGEKKRCHIGIEMIIAPRVLFLDEPTTGLDASTAKDIIKMLKILSQAGRTIVYTIHQPSFSIYREADNLIVLSKGEIAYQGPPMECLDLFQSVGYICGYYNNPADFIVDVLHTDRKTGTTNQHDSQDSGHDMVVKAYKTSDWKKRIETELTDVWQNYLSQQQNVKPPPYDYATSVSTQFWQCCRRTMLTHIRTPARFLIMMITSLSLSFIIGCIYWKIDTSCTSGLQNRVGVFFFVLTNSLFSNISAVDLFIRKRGHFLHETVSGFYRTSAYFLSSVLCDIVIMRLIPTFLLSLLSYFMIGLKDGAQHYAMFLLTLFLTSVTAASVSFTISALVTTYVVGNLIVSLIFMFMVVFSGLLVNLDSIPAAIQWLKHFSILRYSLTVLSINELHDMEFTRTIQNNSTCPTGNDYLFEQGIVFESRWDLWFNIIVLATITTILWIFAYLRLRFMNKLQ